MKNHVAVTKLLCSGFSKDGQSCVFLLNENKIITESINDLGTRNNYYNDSTEKNILANDFESKFGHFYHLFVALNSSDCSGQKELISKYFKEIKEFISIMLIRSPTMFDGINKSLNQIFNSHDDLIKFVYETKLDLIFELIKDKYSIIPIINTSGCKLINNSVGFTFIPIDKYSLIYVPINSQKGLAVLPLRYESIFSGLVLGEKVSEIFNEFVSFGELSFGKNFIFSADNDALIRQKENIEKYGLGGWPFQKLSIQ